MKQNLARTAFVLFVFTRMAAASEGPFAATWLDHLFGFLRPDPVQMFAGPALPGPGLPCLVLPLSPLAEEDSLHLEAAGGEGAVNLEGLLPEAAQALDRFEHLVGRVGGSITLTSAYRPPEYQSHLREVWDKHMELRYNTDPACQPLRVEVAAEFARHELLYTQRPVVVSDHSLGIGFDAAVRVPRRVRVDTLALRAGIHRPDIRRDPVHFRLIGGREYALAQNDALAQGM